MKVCFLCIVLLLSLILSTILQQTKNSVFFLASYTIIFIKLSLYHVKWGLYLLLLAVEEKKSWKKWKVRCWVVNVFQCNLGRGQLLNTNTEGNKANSRVCFYNGIAWKLCQQQAVLSQLCLFIAPPPPECYRTSILTSRNANRLHKTKSIKNPFQNVYLPPIIM